MPNGNEATPPLGLDAITAPNPRQLSTDPDIETQAERLKHQNDKLRLENTSLEQDINERKRYAFLFFALNCVWLGVIAGLLILEGFGHFFHFSLADSVLLAAITSTTANLVGILYVISKYLFSKDQIK